MKCGEFELTHTTNILTNYCNNLYQESDTFPFFLLLLLLFLDLLSNLTEFACYNFLRSVTQVCYSSYV